MFVLEALVLVLSWAVNIVLLFLNASLTLRYQLALLIVSLLIIPFNKYLFSKYNISPSALIKLLLLFLISFLIQLLISSTGGFFSPLLTVLHISILGFGLLLGFRLAFIFLGLSLSILFYKLTLNPELYQIFISDFNSILLYSSSLIAHFLS